MKQISRTTLGLTRFHPLIPSRITLGLRGLLTDVWLAHVCHARRDELPHQRVPDITLLAFGEPVAFLIRFHGVRVSIVDVPARGAQQPVVVVRVGDLDPARRRVAAVPCRLALYGGLDGRLLAALRGEEELLQLAGRCLVGGELAPDEGVELVIGLEMDQLEGHSFGGGMAGRCSEVSAEVSLEVLGCERRFNGVLPVYLHIHKHPLFFSFSHSCYRVLVDFSPLAFRVRAVHCVLTTI